MQHETTALEILSPEQRMDLYAIEDMPLISYLANIANLVHDLALATHPRVCHVQIQKGEIVEEIKFDSLGGSTVQGSALSRGIEQLALATHPRKAMKQEEWFSRLCTKYEIPRVSQLCIHDLTFDQLTDLWSKLLATQGERMMKILEKRSEYVRQEESEQVF